MQTAQIVAEPHQLAPIAINGLTECDIGDWEGKSWEEIRRSHPVEYHRFMANPAVHGYPGGEDFKQVYQRARDTIEELCTGTGQIALVISIISSIGLICRLAGTQTCKRTQTITRNLEFL